MTARFEDAILRREMREVRMFINRNIDLLFKKR
jgi:hypothetical protein